AYVAPDGKPRGYHADNVPFRPQHWLTVSQKGVHRGDLVLILGYPGSTERYLTAAAVADRQGIYYPMRHELLTGVIERIEKACGGDAAMQLRYSATIKSLANVQKNALGMVKGLARNATVQLKSEQEEQFLRWVEADPQRKEKYGAVLQELRELDATAATTTLRDLLFVNLMSSRVLPWLSTSVQLLAAIHGQREGQPVQISRGLARAVQSKTTDRDLSEVQAPVLFYLLAEARRLPESQRLRGVEAFDAKDLAGLRKLLAASPLASPEGRKALLKGGMQGLTDHTDPTVALARALAGELADYRRRHTEDEGRRMVVGPRWISAQQQWRGKSFYPDANSTLRVAIATVKGYQPRDGVWYPPHTTVSGILEKDTGKDPFAVPAALRKAARNRDRSAYFDQAIGDVPVCFLADGDTTGGNSGSPLINGKGELVGLNFDRAFESVSGDYGWNEQRSRNISVDIRYVLWFLEQVVPAKHLLQEMSAGASRAGSRR
ncbi:MAG: S46 family peptidase, partial [Planctomycetes bacterium]|nr:S46 family peptidase [Planctomycetota bacterium]